MSILARILLVFASIQMIGCAYHPEEVADPKSISLRSAVFDVADTLAATKERTRNREKVGLYVDEATVVFNVAAKSTETTGLKLGASSPAGFVPITFSGENSLANEGNRGNTVTVKFKNIATLGKGESAKAAVAPKGKATKNDAVSPVDCDKNPGFQTCIVIMKKMLEKSDLKTIEKMLENRARE